MPASPKPRWRWWLFRAATGLYFRRPFGSRLHSLSARMMGWCVLPSWVADEDELALMGQALSQPDPWEVPHAR